MKRPRRNRLRRGGLLAAFCALALMLPAGCRRNAPASRIVLIVIDTLRADHLPFYGYKKKTAPFLSELAARGIVFGNAFSPSSWTAPATTSIFTSLHPFQHGVVTGILAGQDLNVELQCLPDGVRTLPEMLHKRGYATYGAANNPNICEEMGFARGFDAFANFVDDDDAAMFARLETWAEELKRQRKYFLYIHFNECHHPYVRREPWYEKKSVSREDRLSAYDSEIRYVDEKIRKLSARCGWDEDTLLIVTADHGEEFREHRGIGHGLTLYSEVLRVPLLMVFPGTRSAERRIRRRVSLLDLRPTLREYLGIKADQTEEGLNLLPLLRDESGAFPERALYSHLVNKRRDGSQKILRAVIAGEWKYIGTEAERGRSFRELFNQIRDPYDRHNVEKANRAVADVMAGKYEAYEKKALKNPGMIRKIGVSEKKMRELRALGYVR